MSIEASLFSKLSGDARITSIVGQKISPHVAKRDSELPYITFQRLDSEGVQHMLRPSALVEELFQFDCYSDSSVQVDAMAEALRDIMDGLRGTIGTDEVRRITLQDRRDFVTPENQGAEEYVFRASMDFSIWYVRSVPAN